VPEEIIMLNPANNTTSPIIWEAPHTTRRPLGVHLAPIGSSATQTKICIEKAETFLEKLNTVNCLNTQNGRQS
jgi:hypothetical protein